MTAGTGGPRVDDVVAVVLAAGRGSRMSPVTDRTPKPLLTVNNERLLDLALRRVGALVERIAVNAHHLADQIATAATSFDPEIHISFEREKLLGTAGAVRHLREWIDGRPVLISNSDAWLSESIGGFLDGWDRIRPRLLVQDVRRPADFGTLRYLGVSTVPATMAASLDYRPSGLYSAVWRDAYARKQLDFVEFAGRSFDCGTPAEFLTANLWVGGRNSVVAPDAQVFGTVDRSVVLAGATVASAEHLHCAIRDRFGNTLTADPAEVRVPPR